MSKLYRTSPLVLSLVCGCTASWPAPVPVQGPTSAQLRQADTYCKDVETEVSKRATERVAKNISIGGMVAGGIVAGLGGGYFFNQAASDKEPSKLSVSGTTAIAGAVVGAISAVIYNYTVTEIQAGKSARTSVRNIRKITWAAIAEADINERDGIPQSDQSQEIIKVMQQCQEIADAREEIQDKATEKMIQDVGKKAEKLKEKEINLRDYMNKCTVNPALPECIVARQNLLK